MSATETIEMSLPLNPLKGTSAVNPQAEAGNVILSPNSREDKNISNKKSPLGDLGVSTEEESLQEESQLVDGERVSFADIKKLTKSWNKAVSADNFFANMPFILFLAGLAVIYIYNTHKMETTTREIDKLKNEMKEYRWKYMSAKSNLMYNSKQTEVATAVEPIGLKELRVPPKKIVVQKGEY